MGFRFFRRVKIAPGLSLNFSKSGVSPSIGVRGARVTFCRSGVRRTVGIPGTGLYYTTVDRGAKQGDRSSRAGTRRRDAPPEHDLDLNFFERLTTPRSERAFVDGCKAYVAGRADDALASFEKAEGLPGAAFLAGLLHLKADHADRAAALLTCAAEDPGSLSALFAKYGMDVRVALPITEEVTAHIQPTLTGVMLALAEARQMQGRISDAIECLDRVRQESPEDPVIRLSMIELLLESRQDDARTARRAVEIAGDVANDSPVHTALMLYKARALRALGLANAARDTLTAALRRRKARSPELLRAIRYERALTYEDLGQPRRARRDLETLFAEDPRYEDAARRLGL
ncbi:MAG: DUF4236 domain-containing protein [Planctomycetota bacterium]|nr:MAG: DUF4236 domain-containing protein [Planctomycetota bacterium]